MYGIENTSFLLAHNYELSPSSTPNTVNCLLCIYCSSPSFHRPETAWTIGLTLGLTLTFSSDLFLNTEYRQSDFSRTSPFPFESLLGQTNHIH
jgi:hypothetical protein